MRKARARRTISIIKFYHDHIFISIVKNEFYKIVFNYQNKKYVYSQYDLLLFAILYLIYY